jgi:L-histidine Nalpha-methyltransferase
MPTTSEQVASVDSAVLSAVKGLTGTPKTLPAWLLYDAEGTLLFEEITELPEYYLTRTERLLLLRHSSAILDRLDPQVPLIFGELGAGTATKTEILLSQAVKRQESITYQPIDVSQTALMLAKRNIKNRFPRVDLKPLLANYTTGSLGIEREKKSRVVMMYFGSSIGNFLPEERRALLDHLRAQLRPGDMLLLGVDLIKDTRLLLPAYDDADGTTAAFNLNILARINRELNADFDLEKFMHVARWNSHEERVEMHLESKVEQYVRISINGDKPMWIHFEAGETIHTESSYKFTSKRISDELERSGFRQVEMWQDPESLFGLSLSEAMMP